MLIKPRCFLDDLRPVTAENEKMHTDPDDDKSPTYGKLIKANKLPGGSLESVQKEPEQEEPGQEEEDKQGAEKAA